MMLRTNILGNYYTLFLLIGFVLISYLPTVLQTDTQIFTIPYRGLILVFALFIITKNGLKGLVQIPLKATSLLLIFWLIYLLRLTVDLYFRDVKADVFSNKGDYFLNAVGICFLPMVALMYLKNLDFDWILKWLFRLMLISLVFSLLLNFNVEVEDSEGGRSRGSAALNSIIYGHTGVSFALLSVFLFERSSKYLRKIFYFACFLLGLFIMFIAGSRSPFVALIVCLGFYFIYKKGVLKALLLLSLFIVLFFFFVEDLAVLFPDSSFLARIMSTINTGNSSGRDSLYFQAWEEFTISPFWGNAFLVQGRSYSNYPHNLLLESLMATGVIGSFFFFRWVFSSFKKSFSLIKYFRNRSWLALLFIQYFILGMLSTSLFTNSYFWYYSMLVFSAFYQQNNTTIKS